MILKVTDICCTDINDPTCCHSPNEIRIDRTKAQILFGFSGLDQKYVPQLNGSEMPGELHRFPRSHPSKFLGLTLARSGGSNWFFTKCWDDALVQPGYADNWWSTPRLPNNEQVPVDAEQVANNNNTYAGKGWRPYPLSGYNQNRVPWVIDDWQAGDPDPEWEPVAGGVGWGKPASNTSVRSLRQAPRLRVL